MTKLNAVDENVNDFDDDDDDDAVVILYNFLLNLR